MDTKNLTGKKEVNLKEDISALEMKYQVKFSLKQLKKQQLKVIETVDVLHYIHVEQLIAFLQQFSSTAEISVEDCKDVGEFDVITFREETTYEYLDRLSFLAQETVAKRKSELASKEAEHQLYLKLKKKYEKSTLGKAKK